MQPAADSSLQPSSARPGGATQRSDNASVDFYTDNDDLLSEADAEEEDVRALAWLVLSFEHVLPGIC